ncbi:CatA-like O-acetyltransferase [Sphaerochaeta associata]|uniref:CatA-like O-acetyltransferase n=1 Tax=Sphaerochaeta associata TaxID=1129264 RepID=UPI00396A88C3
MESETRKEYVEPPYCVTVELDVTHFLGRVRPSGCSFTFSMVHLVTSCAQEIEEFRYRFLDGWVVLYRKINTACTVSIKPNTPYHHIHSILYSCA